MRATVVHSPLGIFVFDAEGGLVEKVFFPKDPNAVAGVLEKLEKGGRLDEVQMLKNKLDEKGYSELVFEDPFLASAFTRENARAIVDVEIGKRAPRRQMEEAAREQNHLESNQDLRSFLHDVSVAIARRTVREDSGRRDLVVAQTIQVLDDLDHAYNLFANRLREWYGYHFPEMGGIISESDLYVHLVASLNGRSSFTVSNLIGHGLSSERAEALGKAAQDSMGADLSEGDLSEIVEFARLLLEFHESRTRLDKYLETLMLQVAPNTSKLVGPTLVARLIASVGGLGNLAKKSASTIQILGAEKALFRSLRSGSRPPKHGLIFQHQEIHQAPRWQRGKIARTLASKVAIAARLDAYHGEYMGEELLKDFENRIKEIHEKYPKQPSRGANGG